MSSMEISVSKRQYAFLNASAFEVLYGGAAGGGKSYGQLVDALIYALKYNGSKQIIFRRTFPELEKSLVRTMLGLYPKCMYKYNKSSHTCTFVNGSIIDFAYCENENDVYKYQSAEYDVIRFDELTHFTESMYKYLISRCRGANGFPKHIKSSTNPGGVGHHWVKSRFIDIGEPDAEHVVDGLTRIFIPARLTDNEFLMKSDPEYIKQLEALDERDKKALLYGDWDLTEGRYFTEWDRNVHVITPFIVPTDWNRYIALDYGLDMLAAYKIAVDNNNRAYVLDEIYTGKDNGGDGLIVSEAAKEIQKLIARDKIEHIYAPPDLWNRQKDSGKSIAELFYENGVKLTKVSNDRVSGWLNLREWLRVYPDETGEKTADIRIFSNCLNLIRTLPELQYDPKNPDDCMKDPHELTHAPDALRYFVSGRPKKAKKPPPERKYSFNFEKPKPNPAGLGDIIKPI